MKLQVIYSSQYYHYKNHNLTRNQMRVQKFILPIAFGEIRNCVKTMKYTNSTRNSYVINRSLSALSSLIVLYNCAVSLSIFTKTGLCHQIKTSLAYLVCFLVSFEINWPLSRVKLHIGTWYVHYEDVSPIGLTLNVIVLVAGCVLRQNGLSFIYLLLLLYNPIAPVATVETIKGTSVIIIY